MSESVRSKDLEAGLQGDVKQPTASTTLSDMTVYKQIPSEAAVTPTETRLSSDAKPKVLLKRYRISMQKSGSSLPRVELEELGPSMSLSLDRTREPDKDKWKHSIKVPKAAKPKKVKNVKTTDLGKTVGKFHLGWAQAVTNMKRHDTCASKKKKLAASAKSAEVKPEGAVPTPA
eukprot:g18121.t1